jgi:hypothetical protein
MPAKSEFHSVQISAVSVGEKEIPDRFPRRVSTPSDRRVSDFSPLNASRSYIRRQAEAISYALIIGFSSRRLL